MGPQLGEFENADALAMSWIQEDARPALNPSDDELETEPECQWGAAHEELERLIQADPEMAWLVIRQIVARQPVTQRLASFGAGPLERFLVRHWREFLESCEHEAARSEPFRVALSCVWGWSGIPMEISVRLRRAAGIE